MIKPVKDAVSSSNIVYLSRPNTPDNQQPYVVIPTSPATQLIDDILAAGSCERILLLPERRAQISHGVHIRVMGYESALRIEYTRKDNTCIVEFDNADILAKGHVQALKLFGYLRCRLITSAISAGELIADTLQFTVRDLVEAGLYKTPQSARVGLKTGMEVLMDMKVLPSAPEKHANPAALFYDYHVKNGKVRISLNQSFNWHAIFAHFPNVPSYLFSLSPHAYSLLLYTCELAHQRPEQISTNGFFSIQLKSLQSKLGLPEPDSHAYRNIIGRIEKAVGEIEAKQAESASGDTSLFQFAFTPERPTSIRDLEETRLLIKAGEQLMAHLKTRMKKRQRNEEKTSRIAGSETLQKKEHGWREKEHTWRGREHRWREKEHTWRGKEHKWRDSSRA